MSYAVPWCRKTNLNTKHEAGV